MAHNPCVIMLDVNAGFSGASTFILSSSDSYLAVLFLISLFYLFTDFPRQCFI